MRREQAISWVILTGLIGLFLALLVVVQLSGCTKNTRKDTVHDGTSIAVSSLLVAVNASRDAFAVWDLAHQREILASTTDRDTYNAKIAAYREGQQAKIYAAFKLVYLLIGEAGVKNDQPSFDRAAKETAKLIADIAKLMPEPATVSPTPVFSPTPLDAGAP